MAVLSLPVFSGGGAGLEACAVSRGRQTTVAFEHKGLWRTQLI